MADSNEGVMDSTADTSADLALLNTENDSTDEKIVPEKSGLKPEDRDTPPKEDEEEEPKEGEEEKDEEEEEEKKLAAKPPYDRPTMQELREAFPDLFKKFPSMRDVFYREQEFTQIFPTIEDAKEASVNAQAYNNLSDKVLSGDSEDLLNAVKNTDEAAFKKLATSILPTIYKLSPDLHWQATVPLLQNLVRGFYVEGKRKGNDNIANAAEYLSDFIFNDISIARGEKSLIPERKEESEEAKKLAKDRSDFETQRYNTFFGDVRVGIDRDVKNMINERGKVDPDKVFSEFIRDTIINKVQAEVDKQLAADKAHMKYMSSLWEKAKREGYSEEWKSRISSAYLARAKSLIPSIRAKLISEAMGTSSKLSERAKEIAEKNGSRKESGTGGRPKSEHNGPVDARRVDWSRTSDMDLLNGNVTYRK